MNFWFWLLIILIPVIVFSVKPEANLWLRIGRLALAAAICYGLMFATVGWEYSKEWDAVYAYHEKFPYCTDHECANEPPINFGGPILGVFYVLGWIPATGYTGLWELIWRVRHRPKIRGSGKAFKGKWVSNAVILFAFIASYPTWIFLSRLAY